MLMLTRTHRREMGCGWFAISEQPRICAQSGEVLS